MKLSSLLCITVAVFSLAGAGLYAQQTGTPGSVPPGGGGDRPHAAMNFLTDDEKAKLEAARKKAIESDASLKSEMDTMKQERKAMKDSGVKPTPEQRKEMMAKRKAFSDKLDAATVKSDPSVAPIIEKIKAHHQEMMQNMMDKRGAKKDAGAAATAPAAQ